MSDASALKSEHRIRVKMCQSFWLFPHEMESLLEALRRDFRNEQAKAMEHSGDDAFHRNNARTALRLLESIHPRSPLRQLYKVSKLAK